MARLREGTSRAVRTTMDTAAAAREKSGTRWRERGRQNKELAGGLYSFPLLAALSSVITVPTIVGCVKVDIKNTKRKEHCCLPVQLEPTQLVYPVY